MTMKESAQYSLGVKLRRQIVKDNLKGICWDGVEVLPSAEI